ncbi:hypothetical protein [Thioalkalivibrio sp. HL-Eb18]|uniref:hypothetical protein n=1 Tax=Thioalkalivibrio sp. HL-Eb18 TaxID=1266913 RepID=UPI00035CC302|nr:hypothetical protein [Thioalkalivibrio sp. HL-Eb18]
MLDTEEILKYDRRRIAFHEAGHLAVLFALDGNGYIRIDDPDTRDPINQTCFSGTVNVLVSSPYTRADIFIGLAGKVAEMMEMDGPENFDQYSFKDDIDTGSIELSDTDAAFIEGFTDEDVEAVHNLLLEHWREVRHYATSEIGKFDLMEQGGAYDA